jgi:hypothetical protein
MVKQYEVEICANEIYPWYMQHRMDDIKLEEWEKNRKFIIERDDVAKEDQVRAEFHAYINKKGKFYLPSEHIRCSLIDAGSYMKAKVGNSKKNMSNIVAAMFFIKEDEIPLSDDYDIDKRSAVNKVVKARIISVRPKWKNWKANFTLVIDNDTLTTQTIKELINYAGNYVGIGSYRPQHKGPFGRFTLTKFNEIQ